MSEAEKARLVETVRAAQSALRRGEKLYFTLLSGAPASYDVNRIGPLQAFTQLPLGKIWRIVREPNENPYLSSYRIDVAPDGAGKPFWRVDVVLGAEKDIDRIQLFYGPPPPF